MSADSSVDGEAVLLDPDDPEDAEQIAENLLDRPPASVHDIAYTYGALDSLNKVKIANRAGIDIPIEHLRHMTPRETSELWDSDTPTLLSIRVDLTGETPTLDDHRPVEMEDMDWETAVKIGYSWPIKRRGLLQDHSIAHSVPERDPHGIENDIGRRFTRWPNYDAVEEVEQSHADGWIIGDLRRFGQEGEEINRAVESAAELISENGGSFEGIVSVKIRLPRHSDYRHPGEIDVLREATRQKRIKRLSGYSAATDSSGVAQCYVTGEYGDVVGVTPAPRGYFMGRQLEKFAGFDANESWRNRPLSPAAAATVADARTMVSRCTVPVAITLRNMEMSWGLLPYASVSLADNPDVAVRLYEMVSAATSIETDQNILDVIISELDASDGIGDYLQWAFIILDESGNREDIIESRLTCHTTPVTTLSEAHSELLRSPLFGTETSAGVFPGVGWSEHDLLDPEADQIRNIVIGRYFSDTLDDPTRDSLDEQLQDDDVELQSGDLRATFTADVVGGDAISVERLLESQASRLVKEQRRQMGGDNSVPIPTSVILRQYVQRRALANTGLLQSSTDRLRPITKRANMNDIDMDNIEQEEAEEAEESADDNGTRVDRDARLAEFIDANPALAESDARRGAFLLGGLVGRLTAYQRFKDVQGTLVGNYPIGEMNKRRFEDALSVALDKNSKYADRDLYTGRMNGRYVSRLTDIVAKSPPQSWTISTSELQVYYGLGIQYGYDDQSDRSANNDESSTTEEASEEETG